MRYLKEKFQARILDLCAHVCDGQEEAIHATAEIFAETIMNGGVIQSFGSGHSLGNALEISGRAGGLIQTKLIQATAGMYETVEGIGTAFANDMDLREEDTFVLISNSGRNPLSIEMAQVAKAKGIKIIVVTALDVSKSSTSRHSSGKLLYEYADVVLDNKSIFGDACVVVEELPVSVGGTSLYTGSILLDCAILEAIDIMLDKGFIPPLFMSANVDGGPEYNKKYLDLYKHRLKTL